ncbi:MAG: hypothetical protein HY049_02985 [Acidobacteria bacterium]|nr:hypothetical protein [Acidobacteriota bacterium]
MTCSIESLDTGPVDDLEECDRREGNATTLRGSETCPFAETLRRVAEVHDPTPLPGRARGVVFMGSYQVKHVSKRGLLSGKGSFDIERVGAPAEAEIMARIAPELKGTKWAGAADDRLHTRREGVGGVGTAAGLRVRPHPTDARTTRAF